MSVVFRREGTVAFVTLNSPPVNAIGLSVRQGLLDAVNWVKAQDGLSRVILTGEGRVFAAGADAREFDAPAAAPHLPEILNEIETAEIPWIAAINGAALGGGFEIALACRYRIAHPRALVGLPEVTLGVVPGAGGTQRLPRLIGIAKAVELIAAGQTIPAAVGEEWGIVDGIADDPVAIALGLDIGTVSLALPICDMPAPAPAPTAIEAAQAGAAKKRPNQIAPVKAIELVAMAADTPMAEAMKTERAVFLDLRAGDQARALRHMFFAERAAKAPETLTAPAVDLKHAVVVGGGTMGAGIAYALLNAGVQVTLLETDADAVGRAVVNVDKIIGASLKRGLISDAIAADCRARLNITDDYSQVGDATLAIEAAFESMEVKQAIFAALETHMNADAILATNTSYLDVNEIAASVSDPSRVVGLHFFAPAHIMKLLEIVKGDATSDVALATGFALGKRLRKIPVQAGVCDGFIGNRILARYREAADTVFMDASTPWDVDEAMVEFGYAMGPYEAQDLSGLDIAHANRRRQDATRDPDRRYIPIADRMVELGKLGRKTGAGWYRYPGGGGKVEDPIVADLALEEMHFAGRTRVDITSAEISERLLLAMINEAADILHEGIAQSARDIDLVTVFGYGFPRWRGGLMHYADTLGAAHIVERLTVLSEEDPLVWAPSPVLRECAETGTPLAAYRCA